MNGEPLPNTTEFIFICQLLHVSVCGQLQLATTTPSLPQIYTHTHTHNKVQRVEGGGEQVWPQLYMMEHGLVCSCACVTNHKHCVFRCASLCSEKVPQQRVNNGKPLS